MSKPKILIAALMATTVLAGGAAFAANQATQGNQMQQEQTTADKDAGKLSAEGARAYNDVALTRLAIFDGRIKDAKTFINEADTDFNKAKTDDSVFLKAEADLKSPTDANNATENGATSNNASGKNASADADSSNSSNKQTADTGAANNNGQAANENNNDKSSDMTSPKRWLPVDAEMSVDESYTANPKKVAAVADANKSLAKGDKRGAMEKLKLADVNVAYVMAVVPLDQTLSDVHQAATMVDDGKYYQASQLLRQVQDSTRYDMLDLNGVPTKAGSAAKTEQPPVTH